MESGNIKVESEDNVTVKYPFTTTVVPIQTPFQQGNNSNQFQFSPEFQRFVLNRVHGYQKLAYKLRILNQSVKERVEIGIKAAKISLLNIKNLANSQLGNCIKNLDVFVRGEGLQNLATISPVHFKSIQNINLIIKGTFDEQRFFLNIQQSLIFQNLNVVNKSNLEMLYIKGKQDVTIRDCTFGGLTVYFVGTAQISVVNSRFMNAICHGFSCVYCESILIDQIMIEDCRYIGCYVGCCGNVSIDNIQVVSYRQSGITLGQLNSFKLRNAFVQNCSGSGIQVQKSVGEIQNAHIQGCSLFGVLVMQNSIVRYAQIQCDNNGKGEFFVDGGSEFLRMN